jgi:hypothetical protein
MHTQSAYPPMQMQMQPAPQMQMQHQMMAPAYNLMHSQQQMYGAPYNMNNNMVQPQVVQPTNQRFTQQQPVYQQNAMGVNVPLQSQVPQQGYATQPAADDSAMTARLAQLEKMLSQVIGAGNQPPQQQQQQQQLQQQEENKGTQSGF